MKRFIYFLILASTIVLAGCSKESVNEPTVSKSAVAIKGHTYGSSDASGYVNFYFASNFTASLTANVNGEFTSNSHMVYQIDGNNVDVYRDNSSYWESSARNTLLYHMVYYPSEDKLVWNGVAFSRIN